MNAQSVGEKREWRKKDFAVIIIVLVVMCEKWMRGVEIRIMLSGKREEGINTLVSCGSV